MKENVKVGIIIALVFLAFAFLAVFFLRSDNGLVETNMDEERVVPIQEEVLPETTGNIDDVSKAFSDEVKVERSMMESESDFEINAEKDSSNVDDLSQIINEDEL